MAISWPWVIGIGVFLIFFVIAIVITVYLLSRLKWNYNWVLLREQPNGISEVVQRGKCRLMAFGDGGEEIFYCKGINKWKVAYGKRISSKFNQVAWAVGQDGYWYNISFGPIDKQLLEVGVYPVDRDMRYAYASARKGLERDYEKKSFMDKYGTLIHLGVLGFLVLGMVAFAFVSWSQFNKYTTTNTESTKENLKIQTALADKQDIIVTKMEAIFDKIERINLGGSGAITVPAK